MKMRIMTKVLSEALQDVQMKGKYHNGESAKNSELSNYAMLEMVGETQLALYNADMTTLCRVIINVDEWLGGAEQSMTVVEIDKMLTYLKTYNETTLLDIDDYIVLSDGVSTATLPIVLHHPNSAMIARIQGYNITQESPVFSNVTFETIINTSSSFLTDAVKRCDTINNARYLFDYNGNTLTLGSQKGASSVDKIVTELNHLNIEGDPSTVEVTGQFHKFFRGIVPVTIYLKDESPVIWTAENKILIKAPYITG